MSGIRYALILFIPLVLASFIEKFLFSKNNEMFFSKLFRSKKVLVSLLGAMAYGIGYCMNIFYLSRFYDFKSYNSFQMSNLQYADNNLFFRISTMFMDIFRLFGYTDGADLKTLQGIQSGLAILIIFTVILIVVMIRKARLCLNNDEKFLELFFIITFFLNVSVFLFLEGMYFTRYFIPVLEYGILLLAVCFSHIEKIKRRFIMRAAAFCLLFAISCNYLAEYNLSFGMATFCNAGIMTELTDGKVDVISIHGDEMTTAYKWLQPVRYLKKRKWDTVESQFCFVVLTADEYNNNMESELVLDGELNIFITDIMFSFMIKIYLFKNTFRNFLFGDN